MNQNELHEFLFKLGSVKHEISVLSDTTESLFRNHIKIATLSIYLKKYCNILNIPTASIGTSKNENHKKCVLLLQKKYKKHYFKTFPSREYPCNI